MWNSPSETPIPRNVAEQGEDKRKEKGGMDSGFLSSGNLLVSMEICEQEVTDAASAPGAPEPMRVDSGVDFRLRKSLSQLSLKQVTLNPLATDDRVQTEPTFELTPVTAEELEQREINWQQPLVINWKLYYTQDDYGDTQLHNAIREGFVEAAFSIIEMAPQCPQCPQCCLLDIQNDNGVSPLYLAVLKKQPRIVRRLILAGANPALSNCYRYTALHRACENGDLASAMALTDSLTPLERNYLLPGGKVPALPQNLEQHNCNGETCLHIAAAKDQVELVRLLLRHGADLEAKDGLGGYTALHFAAHSGSRSVVAFLLKECTPCLDARTYGGRTPFQIAKFKKHPQIASELVKAGANPESESESESDSDSDSKSD